MPGFYTSLFIGTRSRALGIISYGLLAGRALFISVVFFLVTEFTGVHIFVSRWLGISGKAATNSSENPKYKQTSWLIQKINTDEVWWLILLKCDNKIRTIFFLKK